ncbi:hypothetical protein RIF29_16241 [Crotalaria pallida]|uniref:NmrA-like domain-containing protein n=1 Tax=Crotalaria pallida TaxID=3830 RepID=A0AAN9FND0_CROPI
MAVKSKILIIGPTGATGRHIVRASVEAGHPTYILVSNTTGTEIPNKPELIATANPETKLELLESFKSSGVTLLIGSLSDHESLVKAIKQVDVVIFAGGKVVLENQKKVIEAIKEAGNVKRFFPSEFGLDVDRHDAVEPVKQVFEDKARFRRQIEAAGIPYTYICCHAYTGYFLRNLAQVGCTKPPRDKVSILGDGNVKGAYVTQEDVGTYTIKAVDDPRTLNKIVHIRLPTNYLTMNEIVSMWENKIGKTLEKIYIQEEQILKNIKEAASLHLSYVWALYHSQQIRGDAVYEIDPIKDFEAHELYPDVKYTTVDEYLDQFV